MVKKYNTNRTVQYGKKSKTQYSMVKTVKHNTIQCSMLKINNTIQVTGAGFEGPLWEGVKMLHTNNTQTDTNR